MQAALKQSSSAPVNADLRLEIDMVDEARWSTLLPQFADASIIHSWAYGATRWSRRPVHRVLLMQGDECVGMAQAAIFTLPGLQFLRMAHIARGPLMQRKGEAFNVERARNFLNLLREEFVNRRGCMLRVMPNHEDGEGIRRALAESNFDKSTEINPARTYLIDLSQSLDDIRKKLDKTWRSSLSKAERSNLTVVQGTDPQMYEIFTALFVKMLGRKNFNPGIDYNEFRKIQKRLASGLKAQIWISYQDGKPTNGAICGCLGDTAIYMLGATDNEFVGANGSYLLQWKMMEYLKQQGFKQYDLGGIDPANNPHVYRFKSGIGAKNGRDVYLAGTFEASRTALGRLPWNGVSKMRKKMRVLKLMLKGAKKTK